jgi:general secretion pathway protein A
MYEQFYGFRSRPFDLTPNPRYFVMTSEHREALSNLEYAIDNRTGITLLIGEAGTGKTTVIRAAIERLATPTHCVHLHNPALTRVEFVQMLAARFSLTDRAQASKAELLLELERLFRQRHQLGERTVLIVDEAQSLPSVLLEEIRLLSNIETDNEKLLSIVIAGQPELAVRLSDPSLRQLKQRIALRCELRPLVLHESVGYIASRISAVGGVPAEVFTREAVTLIHEFAHGIPRTINVIADNALLGGFGRGQRRVTRDLVREVCRDFDIPPSASGGREPARKPTQETPRPQNPKDGLPGASLAGDFSGTTFVGGSGAGSRVAGARVQGSTTADPSRKIEPLGRLDTIRRSELPDRDQLAPLRSGTGGDATETRADMAEMDDPEGDGPGKGRNEQRGREAPGKKDGAGRKIISLPAALNSILGLK